MSPDITTSATPTPVVSAIASTPSALKTPAPSPTPETASSAPPLVADLVVKITKPDKKVTSDLGKLLFLSAELENPSDVPVSFVEFRRDDDTVIGLVPKSAFSSFSYNWTPEKINSGTYSVFAVALDVNKQILAKSEAVEVTLKYVSSSSGGGGGGGSSSFVAPPPAATPTPAPTLTNFNPGSGFPGNAVVITGTNFTGTTAISFNGVAAASFTVDSATQITAIAPTGATNGMIGVTAPGGSVNSATNFTFTAPPAGVHFVKADATGANSGANWIGAYPDLVTALGAVGSGEEIWIAAGTYKPTTGADRTIAFTLATDASLYGGFVGTEALRTDRDFTTNSSILSGDLTGDDAGFTNNGENSYHVVTNTAANGRLDGLIIQNGNSDAGVGPHNSGSGLFVQADITIANTRFQTNDSSNIGAIYSVAQTLTIDNCTFDNNRGALGGAILNQGGTLNISNNTVFSNNLATTAGGAIYTITGSTINISDTTFNMNSTTAAGAGAGGGAIYHNAGNMTVTDTSFTNNSTGQEGGAVFQRGADIATYTRVIFQNNTATNFGGAICNDSSTSNVNESIFDTNMGIRGGAIFGNGMSSTMQNSVFVNNSATQQGGAIAQPSGTIVVKKMFFQRARI